MKTRLLCLALALTLACTPSSTSPDRPAASGEETARGDQICLDLAWIFRTVVVDNRTILFRMLDGSIWRNRLPQNCTGLAFQEGFAYETTIPRICEFDLIRVLGPTSTVCQLGSFAPYAPAEGPGGNPENEPGSPARSSPRPASPANASGPLPDRGVRSGTAP